MFVLSINLFAQTNTWVNKADSVEYEYLQIYPSTFDRGCASLEKSSTLRLRDSVTNEPYRYLTGSNNQGDSIYAQRYIMEEAIDIYGVAFYMIKSADGEENTELFMKMYEITEDTIFTEINSKSISTEDIPTKLGVREFYFDSARTVTDFAVGISVTPFRSDDKNVIIIASSKQGCYSNEMSYVLNGGKWETMEKHFETSTLDLDLFIFPIYRIESIITPPDTGISINTQTIEKFTFVSPVPASDRIVVSSSFSVEKVELFNLTGQKVLHQELNGISAEISVAHLPAGTYITKVYTKAGVASKKIIIQ